MANDLERVRALAPPDPVRGARLDEIERRPATIAARKGILGAGRRGGRSLLRRARPLLLSGAIAGLAIGGIAWWAGTGETTGPTRIVLGDPGPSAPAADPNQPAGVEAIVKVWRDGRPSDDLEAAADLIRRRATLMLLRGATVQVQKDTGTLRVFVPGATSTRPSSRLLGDAAIRIVDVADLEIGAGSALVASARRRAPMAPAGGWFLDGYGTFPPGGKPPKIPGVRSERLPAGWQIYRPTSVRQARRLGASRIRLANVLVRPFDGIRDEEIRAVFRGTNDKLQRVAKAQLLLSLEEGGRERLSRLFARQRERAASTGKRQFYAIVAGQVLLAVAPTSTGSPARSLGPVMSEPFGSNEFRFALSALALTGGSSFTFETATARTIGQTPNPGKPLERFDPGIGRGFKPGSIRELAKGSTRNGPWRVVSTRNGRGRTEIFFGATNLLSSVVSIPGVCGTGIDSPLLAACALGAPMPLAAQDAIFAVGASVRTLEVAYGNGERRRYAVDGGFAGISISRPKALSVTALDRSGDPLGSIALPAPSGYSTGP